MSVAFRSAHDLRPAARVGIQVLGFRQRFDAVTGAIQGSGSWFCFVFHDVVPVLSADGWRECRPGDCLIQAPEDPIRHGRDGAWHRSWIRCQGTGIGDLLMAAGLPRNRLLPAPVHLHEAWLLRLQDELDHGPEADEQILAALLTAWWRDLARASSSTARTPPAVLAAKRIIEQHFREPLRLDGLAIQVGCSRTRLCRQFKQAFDTTPMQYAGRLRLQHAADLLTGSDHPIGAIAETSGFGDVYYFSRAFRARYGMPPSAYRQAHGNRQA